MKTIKILMMAVLSILTMAVFAQNNSIKNHHSQISRSKKELMKMEVMKIQNTPEKFERKILSSDNASNLSLKEQMKTSVMKLKPVTQYYTSSINRSGKCITCLKVSTLSLKEQLKMKVVGLDSCPIGVGISSLEVNNCSVCKMDITICK